MTAWHHTVGLLSIHVITVATTNNKNRAGGTKGRKNYRLR
jgi:hypothetical protein